MDNIFSTILALESFDASHLKTLLSSEGDEKKALFEKANEIKQSIIGNKVFFRGIIEYSNFCQKDCFYCGIRKSNNNVKRYTVSDSEVIDAALFAFKNRYGSIVLQSGEMTSPAFVERIENLLKQIKVLTSDQLGVTLSLGEQSEETYQRWKNAGAHRYLLRIESSNKQLYAQMHPNDEMHDYDKRLSCLKLLKKVGYQVGTGVMIGVPGQTIDNLVEDLLFMKELDIDMCGMGPYLEHEDTPMYEKREMLFSKQQRFELALKMVATLRLFMKDINIAATTALQAIDPVGREKALKCGANIIMPNITPARYRSDYKLYENKPCTDEAADDCLSCLDVRISLTGNEVGYDQWGDSQHFQNKNKK
jgi:biotin synthase